MTVLLGRTTAGTSGDFVADGRPLGSKFTAAASGTLATIFAQFKVVNPGLTSVELGIYDDTGGGLKPGNKLASGTTTTGITGTGSFSVSGFSVPITASTVYWLAWRGVGEQQDFQGTAVGSYAERTASVALEATWGANATGATDVVIWGEDSGVAVQPPPAGMPLVFPLRLFGMMGPPLIAGFEGDAVAVTALSGSDSATGSDDGAVSATVPGSDTAAGTDAGTVSATVAGTDTGTATDAGAALSVTGSGADTGSGSDAGAVSATLAGADSGVGTDAGTVVDVTGGPTLIADSDAGTATETGTLVDLTPPPEEEDLGDVSSIFGEPLRALSDSDHGTGTETARVVDLTPIRLPEWRVKMPPAFRRIVASDGGVATDGQAVSVTLAGSDMALATDDGDRQVTADPQADIEDREFLMMLLSSDL